LDNLMKASVLKSTLLVKALLSVLPIELLMVNLCYHSRIYLDPVL